MSIYPISSGSKYVGITDCGQQQTRPATIEDIATLSLGSTRAVGEVVIPIVLKATPQQQPGQEKSLFKALVAYANTVLGVTYFPAQRNGVGCGANTEPAPFPDAGKKYPETDGGYAIPTTSPEPKNLQGDRFSSSDTTTFTATINIGPAYLAKLPDNAYLEIEIYSNPMLMDSASKKLIDPKNPDSLKIPCKDGALRLVQNASQPNQEDAAVPPPLPKPDSGPDAGLPQSDTFVPQPAQDMMLPDTKVASDAGSVIAQDAPHTDPFASQNWAPAYVREVKLESLKPSEKDNPTLYPPQTTKITDNENLEVEPNQPLAAVCDNTSQPNTSVKVEKRFYQQDKWLNVKLSVPVTLDQYFYVQGKNNQYILVLLANVKIVTPK